MKETRSLYRAFLILIFGAFSFQINGQIDTQILKKQWISVQNRYTDKSDGYYVKEANIIYFTDSHIEGYYAWDDSLSTFSFEKNDSLIFCDNTLEYGKILFLSNDSMRISIDHGKMIATYIPIEDKSIDISKRLIDNILTKKAWSKICPYGELRYDFWDIVAFPPLVKYCNVIVEDEYDFYHEGSYWTTFEYGGNIFMYLSIDPSSLYEPDIFQVLELDSSLVKVKPLSPYETDSLNLIAIENLSTSAYSRFERVLTSREWQINNIQETKRPDEEIIPIVRQRQGVLPKDEFLQRNFKYSFSDSTYSISGDSLSLSEGKWSLSRDGKFMYLYNENSGSSLVKILKFNENEITIRQKIELKVSQETDEIMIYDFKIKLN